jgi:carboxylate-amine ligase
VAAEVLAAMDAPEAIASHEAYAAQVELRSPPSPHAAAAADALAGSRSAARAAGATLMGAGLHPADDDGDSQLVDSERYRRVARMMRGLFARTPEAALHVHVGMPDPETAIRAFNGLRSHLPLLQGLSANSPWWFGRDSGLASARYALVRTYPGRGVPPAFPDFDAYLEATERTLAAGGLDEYTLLWWDVRPHPKLGTVELREMDVQSSIEDAAALAALVQALAVEAAEARAGGDAAASDAISMSAFRAARDGIDATILDGTELAPLREVARATVERVRPRARELGADAPLDGIDRIVSTGGGAGRQRAAHARGGLRAALEQLVRETHGD